jgi:hypothetical protein
MICRQAVLHPHLVLAFICNPVHLLQAMLTAALQHDQHAHQEPLKLDEGRLLPPLLSDAATLVA